MPASVTLLPFAVRPAGELEPADLQPAAAGPVAAASGGQGVAGGGRLVDGAGAAAASGSDSPPPWPPPDAGSLPAGLDPLPDPSTWTGNLIDRSTWQELVDEGYPANYVTEWQRAVEWWVLHRGQGGGGGGGGGVDVKPVPPSSGDPAGDPGAPPTLDEYGQWEVVYRLAAERH